MVEKPKASAFLFFKRNKKEKIMVQNNATESGYPITEERQKLLESAAGQIERTVPDLAERVEQSNQKELEL